MARTTIRTEDITASEVTTAKMATDPTNASNLASGTVPTARMPATGISWQAITTGTTLTAVAGNGYPINTTSNACTVSLPATASVGDEIQLVDYAGTWDTNNVTIDPQSLNIKGASDNLYAIYERESITLTYVDATQGWVVSSSANATSPAIGAGYAVDWLVIGGGGSGGNNRYYGGGGGAGGFRYATGQTILSGSVYTATVGAGGTIPSPGGTGTNNQGNDSSISGTGITTYTAAGGGRGGNTSDATGGRVAGAAGGSGGGASRTTGGAGNTPSTSPVQGYAGGPASTPSGVEVSGGGGGAGEAGNTNGEGRGGDGAANSITGASVTYAGGGGGSRYNSSTPNVDGGSGGGGNGSQNNGTPGTDGLGGGGGGSERLLTAANGVGGDGIVILRILTSDYTTTVTGSPTVTTDGSYTVVKFTATGSYTA